MLISKRLFRLLIVACISTGVIAMLINLIPGAIPESLSKAEQALQTTESVNFKIGDAVYGIALLFSLLLLIAQLIGFCGMYFFKPWSRKLTFVTACISFPMAMFTGPTVLSAYAEPLVELSYNLWGAVMALAYYSSISENFTASKR